MLTPTLLDVVGLTALKPTGQTFDPDSHHSEMTFDFSRLVRHEEEENILQIFIISIVRGYLTQTHPHL